MFGIDDFSINFLSDTIVLNCFAFLLLLLTAVFVYRKTNPPLPRYLQVSLLFLRLFAITVLFVALFEPILSYTKTYERKPAVAVLLDESLSMEETELGQTRRTKRDLLLSSESYDYLNDKAETKIYYFGANLSTDKKMIKNEATAIGDALLELESKELAEPADYYFLFSDGNSNAGRKISDVAGKLSNPVYTIDLSIGGNNYDMSISEVDFNPVLFAGQTSEINLRLQWQNSENRTLPIQLTDSGKIITESKIVINQEEGISEVTIKYTPTSPGQKILTLSVPPLTDEVNKSNNRYSFSVKVLKSKLTVLMLAEQADHELGFLKRYLQNAKKYEIDLRLLGEKGGNFSGTIPSRQTELNYFDLIILYDVSPEKLGSKQALLETYLKEKGGSVWVIMGESFAASQPLTWFNNLLPFYPDQARPVAYRSFQAEPDEENLYHPAVRFEDNRAAIRKAWMELPPFEILVRAENINPNAHLLAYASGIRMNDKNLPILGFMRHGPGKLLASAAQPFWNFGFVALGFGESDVYYQRFVEGAASWLTVSDDMDPIRINPLKNVYNRGEIVSFDGYAFDLGYRPIPEVTGSVTIFNNTGDQYQADLIPEKQSPGKHSADLFNIKPGSYRYQAEFRKDGGMLKEFTGQIEVNKFSLEEYNIGGDPVALSLIADLSGGRYYPYDRFEQAVQELPLDMIDEFEERELSLWDKVWMLVLFIGLLSLEWMIRKMNQLI